MESETNILLSIIILAHNCAHTINDCVDSIIKQKEERIEIIIIEDDSIDNTIHICKTYSQIDKRVKLYQVPPMTIPQARQVGINKALGEWVTFVDADDRVNSNYCKVAMSCFLNREVDIWNMGHYVETERGVFAPMEFACRSFIREGKDIDILQLDLFTKRYDPLLDIRANCSIGGLWCKFFKRKIVTDNHICFNDKWKSMEDTFFSLYLFEYADKVGYVSDKIYYLNRKSGNHSAIRMVDWYNIYTPIILELEEFVEKYHKDKRFDLIPNTYERANALHKEICYRILHKDNQASFIKKRQDFILLSRNELNQELFANLNRKVFPRFKKRCFLYAVKYKQYILIYLLVFFQSHLWKSEY